MRSRDHCPATSVLNCDKKRERRNRTPREWFSAELQAEWAVYDRLVEDCAAMKDRRTRGFYLRRNAAEAE